MWNTPFPTKSISSKPTALLLGMKTLINENPCAHLRPAAAQSEFNKGLRRCVGLRDGVSLWEDDLDSCLYSRLADKWLNISTLLISSAAVWKWHAHSPLTPSSFWFWYSSRHGFVCFWCVNAMFLFLLETFDWSTLTPVGNYTPTHIFRKDGHKNQLGSSSLWPLTSKLLLPSHSLWSLWLWPHRPSKRLYPSLTHLAPSISIPARPSYSIWSTLNKGIQHP